MADVHQTERDSGAVPRPTWVRPNVKRKIVGYTIAASPIWGFCLGCGIYGTWLPAIAVAVVLAVGGLMLLGLWIARDDHHEH